MGRAALYAVLGVAAASVGALLMHRPGAPSSSAPSALPDRASELRIDELHPSIQPFARELVRTAAASGIELAVTDGYRSNEQQAELYAQGRTKPGLIVTHAKPGQSWHNYGLAFDVAVMSDGRWTWPNDMALWERIGALGKSVGLEWGGDFPEGQVDRPHFEHRGGLTIAQAAAGERPEVVA